MVEKNKILEGILVGDKVFCDFSDLANKIYNGGTFGSLVNKKLSLTLIESLYLLYKKKIVIFYKKKELNFEDLLFFSKKKEKDFWIKYCVFKDLRDRGYVVRTALKFGAEYRVYDRGIKPGQDHAKWIAFPVSETTKFNWYDFAAKGRVAHSTRKRLLICLVDKEDDVTYYEIAWKRP